MMDYNLIWYFGVGFLLIGYAILDGFDLGVGIIHLFTKTDHDRRVLMNSIGPVWDGNEVWLITAGGALFAAFPEVYATVFSAFYLPFMILLVSLIFRAVSLEFRSKEKKVWWRRTWDFMFFLGSLSVTFCFGLLIGNAVKGIPMGADFEYIYGSTNFFNPYSVAMGLFTISMFAMHGLIYLGFKTDEGLYSNLKRLFWPIFILFCGLFIIVSGLTVVLHPWMLSNFSFGLISSIGPGHELLSRHQVLISVLGWIIVVLNILAVMNIPRMFVKGKYGATFVSSVLLIAGLIALFALGLFPNLVFNTLEGGQSIHIYNGASTSSTLKTMLIMGAIGIPFVLSYTITIYWVFRGKTTIDDASY